MQLCQSFDKLLSANDLLKEKDGIIAQVLHPTLADMMDIFVTCTRHDQNHACGNLLDNLAACIAHGCRPILFGEFVDCCRIEPLQNCLNCISARSSGAHMAS